MCRFSAMYNFGAKKVQKNLRIKFAGLKKVTTFASAFESYTQCNDWGQCSEKVLKWKFFKNFFAKNLEVQKKSLPLQSALKDKRRDKSQGWITNNMFFEVLKQLNTFKNIQGFWIQCLWETSQDIKTFFYNGEFDPGSGWTLAAGLTHASRGAA